ncbi:hypothetical protein [Micromonospora sp. WMMC250]|uniref:hypothetical protein n=1 Tax=Micromonospora sp. WMMC250 TaxID=3014781 RepID=UPI0022B713C9|nr:hypothetical protein [Micromonospora sp. WMMC250]MCZ7376514.1 hypothetical protein [Micromonospora sp. WMMC250]
MLIALILAVTHALALTAGAWFVHRRYLARLRREAAWQAAAHRVGPSRQDAQAWLHRNAERARVHTLFTTRRHA